MHHLTARSVSSSLYAHRQLCATLAATLSIVALVCASPLAALIDPAVPTASCVNDVSGLSNNCTANDLTFVVVGLGVQDDGCVNASDTITIFLRTDVTNTTAKTRYDVGLYFAKDGDPNGDGGLTGTCAREILSPLGTVGTTACPPLNLGGGDGPYYNDEGDGCGDLINQGTIGGCDLDMDGLRDPAQVVLNAPVTFPCREEPIVTPDGFVNIPVCATWGNQNNQVSTVAPAGQCNSDLEAIPGTKSKCRCEDVNTNVPAPELSLSCSCTAPTTVRPGFPVSCSVTYNNSRTCTPDPLTAERFQCAAASYLRFSTADGSAGGSFGNITAGTGSTSGTGPLVWTPASQPEATAGIIGQGETASVSFDYTVSNTAPDGTITLTTTSEWSNVSTFSPSVTQSALTTNCSITVSATHATIADLQAQRRAKGGVEVRWQTASEADSLGFELQRWDAERGEYIALHRGVLPATQHLPGGNYRFVDAGAPTDTDELQYRITEVEMSGLRGPQRDFRVSVERVSVEAGGLRAESDAPRGAFSGQPIAPSTRQQHRLADSLRQQRTRTSSADVAQSLLPVRSASQGFGKASPNFAQAVAFLDIERLTEAGQPLEGGLVRVSVTDLAAATGLRPALAQALANGGRWQLSRDGEPIAWRLTDDGSAIEFYASALPEAARTYSRFDVYRLSVADGPHTAARVKTVRGELTGGPTATPGGTFRASQSFEQEVLGRPLVTNDPSADYWFWDGVLSGHPSFGNRRLDFSLAPDGEARLSTDNRLSLRFWGLSDTPQSPDHQARIWLNGIDLGTVAWNDLGAATLDVEFGRGALRNDANRLVVEGLVGNFLIDGFDLHYDRAFRASTGTLHLTAGERAVVTVEGLPSANIAVWELSSPTTPRRLQALTVEADGTGTWNVSFRPSGADVSYLVTSERQAVALRPRHEAAAALLDTSTVADYVVIAPAMLHDAAQALAELRRAGGLSTLVIEPQAIYDAFGHGRRQPQALRTFFQVAYETWQAAPRYAVLAGKGSYDYRDLLQLGGNLIPPFMAAGPGINSPFGTSLAAADSLLGDIDGDGIPNLALGRLPVVDNAELQALVDKIADYEQRVADQASDTPWLDRSLILSDVPDGGGDFTTDADALAARLPDTGTNLRLATPTTSNANAVRAQLLQELADGARLLGYVGHGGFDRLSGYGLLTSSDVPSLARAERPPLVTAMTCNIGMFAFPGFTALGEELVLLPTGGAIAVWGPTGLSFNTPAVALGGQVFDALFEEPVLTGDGTPVPAPRLGDRLTEGWRRHATGDAASPTRSIYGLLGDPALLWP